MAKFELTPYGGPDAAWRDGPPDALDDPALYEGVMGRRVLAYGIDVAILALVLLALWVPVVLSFGLLWPAYGLAAPTLPLIYHSYFVGRRGATPGMHIMNLEARSWSGRRPDYPQAFLMTVLFYATVMATGFLVLLVALLNDRRRTLHDFLAGTLVVRRNRLARGATGPA